MKTYAINEWHRSKSGKVNIHLEETGTKLIQSQGRMVEVTDVLPQRFAVTALDGHELLPATRNFDKESDARAYANTLWARY